MRQYSMRTSVLLFAVGGIVVLSLISASAEAASISDVNKQELQSPVPDAEKFLYDLNRYFYRQQQRQRLLRQFEEQQEDDEDDSSELNHLTHHGDGAMHKYRTAHQRRLNWPFWSTKTAEAKALSEGGPASGSGDPNPPYEKRNSELINSLLGLPRVMKVVG